MCGLCGIFSEDMHWAARLDAASRGQSSNSALRRLARTRRISVLNRMLAGHHVRISDWQGNHYCVQGATGRTELVSNLSQLWLAVEKVGGRPFDPLDC